MSTTVRSHKDMKKFVKTDEVASGFGKALAVILSRKNIVIPALIGIIGLAIYFVGFRIYVLNQVEDFNAAYAQASEGLQKEKNFKQILQDYAGLPAHHLVRMELADYYLENQSADKAIAVLQDGLANNTSKDILATLMVLKVTEIYKTQNELEKAVAFLDQSKSKVLPEYMADLDLLKAENLELLGKKDQARQIYQSMILPEGVEPSATDPEASRRSSEAQLHLLKLELGY